MVDSFMGAIALGWLFAQAIINFVSVFIAPVSGWLARTEYQRFSDHASSHFLFRDSLPELARSFFLFLFWYILLRWLYFTPAGKETHGPTSNPEQPA
jgi:hypothetical protein